jgi:hypothetical protein
MTRHQNALRPRRSIGPMVPAPPDVETTSGGGDAKPEQRRSANAEKPPTPSTCWFALNSGEIAIFARRQLDATTALSNQRRSCAERVQTPAGGTPQTPLRRPQAIAPDSACKIQNRARRTRRCDRVRTFRYQLPTVQATGDVAVRNDPVAQRIVRIDPHRPHWQFGSRARCEDEGVRECLWHVPGQTQKDPSLPHTRDSSEIRRVRHRLRAWPNEIT